MISTVISCWALLLGVALLMVGNGLQGTLLGVRASFEGFPTAITGILMSGYFAGFLGGSLLTPKLVARVGHVRVFAALASLASAAILLHVVFINPVSWTLMRLVSGLSYAGLYVVAESWLNDQASNENRGQLLSVYMVIMLGGMAAGQGLLNLADPSGPELFILVSVLVSLALIPMLLSAGRIPAVEAPTPVGIRELYRASPTGVVAAFGTLLAHGAVFGMGAVYAREAGLSLREVSLFMALVLIGGVSWQWPIGRLSDRYDRRLVMTVVSFLAAAFALVAAALVGRSGTGLFAAIWLFGGMTLPMYSLCIAYTNDYLRPDQIVDASGTLVLVGGLGASLGPVTAAAMMTLFGPNGFLWWLATIHGAIGLFAIYRMTRRATPEEQGAYVAMPPRATPIASAIYAEAAAEMAEAENAETPSAQPVAVKATRKA